MSAAQKLTPALMGRIEKRLGVERGAVEVLDFYESDDRFGVSYRRGGQRFGMYGIWDVPPEWKGKAISRPAKKRPPPKTWMPGVALHQLRPSLIERLEVSYKMEPGAIGRGELGIQDFQHVRDDVYRVDIYIPATDFRGSSIGLLMNPMPRRNPGPNLDGDDFAAVVRVFAMLLKRDRELETAGE